MNCFVSVLILFFVSSQVQAIEYNELEVYGYQTTQPHELEIENATSVSSNDQQSLRNRIVRSTFELSYGVSDRWEATAYLDYMRPQDEKFEYSGFRAHVRTRFAEKGELPVDFGAYLEVELPKDTTDKDVALEFKPIIEKDFSRWTLSFNPQIEFEHEIDDKDPNATAKTWHTVFGLSTSLAYRYNENFKPHLDLLQGFTDQDALLMPSVDVLLVTHLKLTLGLGFGLNDRTEKKIANGRLEYELYF